MLEGGEVHLVDSFEEASHCAEWMLQQSSIAVDTETAGLAFTDPVRILQIGSTDRAYVFPVELPRSWAGLAMQFLEEFTGTIVGHHWKFDAVRIERTLGLRLPWHQVHDTMLQARVLEPLRSAALKNLATRFVDSRAAVAQADLDERMKQGKHTWATVPVTFEPYWFYAGLDCMWTLGLHQARYPEVQTRAPLAYDLERSAAAVCSRMEVHGALIDQDYAQQTYHVLSEHLSTLYGWCQENYGVKPGSNASIVKVLEEAGFEFDKVTKTGAKTLDKEVLGSVQHPLAQAVLAHRQAQKVRNTYLKHFIEDVDVDGRIHPQVNTCEAKTSRMSMEMPNLQNLPRRSESNPLANHVRNCIVADEGNTLVMCDFDQIEWRLFASLAKDPALQAAFQADDFFTEMVRQVFQDPTAQRGDPRRQTTKNAMYARIYGAGTAKFAWTAGITEEEAQQFTAMLDYTYPSIRAFTRSVDVVSRARYEREGEAYVLSPLTRRRFIIDDDAVYKLVNYLIQGTAAEVLKMKLIELSSAGLGEYLVCPVHDEVILEVPSEDVHDVAHTVLSIMNDKDLFAVPITASLSTGRAWGQKVDYTPTR